MSTDATIDLDAFGRVAADRDRDLNQVRSVLLAPSNDLLEQQRLQIEALSERIVHLENLVADTTGRAHAVDEVLVDAVRQSIRPVGELGIVLQPEIDHAIYTSARTENTMLAEALYPVIGPAVRKMIAAMFRPDSGNAFYVEQILLIERSTGLMLTSTATDERALDDADVVSGMIDALTSFVQDAFATSSNDGLQDLRVGDLSLLVETGPHAVLASVVRGIPTQSYRNDAASTLESLHVTYAEELASFDGSVEPFDGAGQVLGDLHEGVAAATTHRSLGVIIIVASVALALLLIAGVLVT